MNRKTLLVTGSSGLIGSEVVEHFCRLGWDVHGVDNNMRADFFGPQGDTRWNLQRLQAAHPTFVHHELDVRNRDGVLATVRESGRRPSSTPPRSPATTWPRVVRSTTSTSTPWER
jgi:nucleoside-diphosphate-sugar epimerase